MEQRSGWVKAFLHVYEDSPLPTWILNDQAAVLWENQSAKNVLSPLEPHLFKAYRRQQLLDKMLNGFPFHIALETSLRRSAQLVLHPQLDDEKRLLGAIVHWMPEAVPAEPERKMPLLWPNPLDIFNNQFRTPLSQIFSALNLLHNGEYREDEPLQRQLYNIDWNCYRILRSVIHFSLDSQIFSGQMKPHMECQDLRTYVKQLCLDTAEHLAFSGYDFVYEVSEKPAFALFDPKLFSIAVFNLLSNAIRYSDPKDGPILLKLSIRDKAADLILSDHGCGLGPEALSHAFERFYSKDPQISAPGGDGLGLYLTQQILKAHGGTAAIQSQQGLGTTAALTIPLIGPGDLGDFQNTPVPFENDRFSSMHVILSDVVNPTSMNDGF